MASRGLKNMQSKRLPLVLGRLLLGNRPMQKIEISKNILKNDEKPHRKPSQNPGEHVFVPKKCVFFSFEDGILKLPSAYFVAQLATFPMRTRRGLSQSL